MWMSFHREKVCKDQQGFIEKVFDSFGRCLRPGVLNLGFVNLQGFTGKFPRGTWMAVEFSCIAIF